MTDTVRETRPAEHTGPAVPRSRRGLRWGLMIGFLPVAVILLLLAGKLFGLSPAARDVMRDYDRGYYDGAVTAAEPLFGMNWFEPWIASFDRGTAYAGQGLYNEAIDDLETAFDRAPADRRCDVAVNLSLTWERLGDSYVQQGLYAGAQRLYQTAQAVIDAAGESCQPPNAPRNAEENRDPGQELSDAADRLANKSRQSGQAQDQQGGSAPSDLDDQLDELGQQQQDAADEKAQQEGQQRGENGGGGFTDKPW